MPGRPEVPAGGDVGGEAEGVVDLAVAHLVPPQQPRQDRQPGGVRGGPAVRAQVVAVEVEDRPRARPPPVAAHAGVPRLVEPAAALVDDDRVLVARRVPAALDQGVPTERVAHRVALGRVLEAHPHLPGAPTPRRSPAARSPGRRRTTGRSRGAAPPRSTSAPATAGCAGAGAGRRRPRATSCPRAAPGTAPPPGSRPERPLRSVRRAASYRSRRGRGRRPGRGRRGCAPRRR